MLGWFRKKKKEPQSLKEVLKKLKDVELEVKKVSADLKSLKEKNKDNIQKIGIVRYNPFSEIGGDQSFSVALLDDNDNGVVITSLYTREGNRVYGKPVVKGKSEYLLTEEEKKAILKAQEKNYDTKSKKSKPHHPATGSGGIGPH